VHSDKMNTEVTAVFLQSRNIVIYFAQSYRLWKGREPSSTGIPRKHILRNIIVNNELNFDLNMIAADDVYLSKCFIVQCLYSEMYYSVVILSVSVIIKDLVFSKILLS